MNLNEDDGLSPWIRAVVRKIFILKQFKGAVTAESYDAMTEDEQMILEVVLSELGSKSEEETVFG